MSSARRRAARPLIDLSTAMPTTPTTPATPTTPGSPPPAKYVVVRDHLLALVAQGLAPGTPVPSERELCESFGVSRMTVRQAIDTLVVTWQIGRASCRERV